MWPLKLLRCNFYYFLLYGSQFPILQRKTHGSKNRERTQSVQFIREGSIEVYASYLCHALLLLPMSFMYFLKPYILKLLPAQIELVYWLLKNPLYTILSLALHNKIDCISPRAKICGTTLYKNSWMLRNNRNSVPSITSLFRPKW